MQRNNIYKRPAKPRSMVVPNYQDPEPLELERLNKPLVVDKATECHVTPLEIAAEMFYYADIKEGHKVLEPSGGTGNLAFAIADRGHAPQNITVVERHYSLVEAMFKRVDEQMADYPHNRAQEINIEQADFLEWAKLGRKFDRIVMNPPFRAVKAHIAAAEKLLRRGGVLVAIVPVTFKHSTAETLKHLANETFTAAKVNTKIIRII